MKVYVVITNGEEIKGQVEGVFAKEEDARAKFNELINELRDWAEDDEIEEDATANSYCQTNFDQDEYNEVKIVESEVK